MNITLTVEAAPALQAVLEKIAANLGSGGNQVQEPENSTNEEKKTRKTRAPKTDEPSVTPPAPEKVDDGLDDISAPTTTAKVYTAEEIRALGRTEAQRVGTDKVRELIKEMGFEKLPEMTADRFSEFAEKVAKLK